MGVCYAEKGGIPGVVAGLIGAQVLDYVYLARLSMVDGSRSPSRGGMGVTPVLTPGRGSATLSVVGAW